MTKTSDYLLNRLRECGRHRISGYSCDGVNSMLDTCHRARRDPGFIEARQEGTAAFMANGRSNLTADFGPARAPAFAASGPVALEVVGALRQGDPDAWGIPVTGAKQKIHEFTESTAGAMPGDRS